ncbi:hypothetical protein Tco_1249895 [Tanacetum coccineum]
MRMGPESGAGDEDYVQKALIHYQIDTGIPFKFRYCWEILKNHPKRQEIAIPTFSTVVEGSSKEALEIQRPQGRDKAKAAGKKRGSKSSASASSSVNEDALARDQEELRSGTSGTRDKTTRHEVLSPTIRSLDRDQRKAMDEIRAKIKAKYNLLY